MIAVNLDRQVGDHVAQLRAALMKSGEPLGKGADRGVPRMPADRRAVERAVPRKAVDDRLDIAAVERRRVAHEQIVDREPVFQISEGHGGLLSLGHSIGMKIEWRILFST